MMLIDYQKNSHLIRFIFLPLTLIYGIAIIIINYAYKLKIFKSYNVSKSVISIGNITTGGTGKTPMTYFITKQAKIKGFKPGIISRGYGRSSKGQYIVHDGKKIQSTVEESGDEPFLLAKILKNVPIIVDEDKIRAAKALIAQFDVNLIIIDDGFQYRRLHRDVDIVLLNSRADKFSYFLLPVGNLREQYQSLKRSDHIVITKGSIKKIPSKVRKYIKNGFQSNEYYSIQKCIKKNGEIKLFSIKNSAMIQSSIFVFSGIANATLFHNKLEEKGYELGEIVIYKDHVRYTNKRLRKLKVKIKKSGLKNIITTEKDLVKLPISFIEEYHIFILKFRIKIENSFMNQVFNKIS